ncbi:hypothetical protein PM082_009600 [Marasmius tenuissimus]|nr:hypothetical protein PM082_009600 [Marasmius tenuissimus]
MPDGFERNTFFSSVIQIRRSPLQLWHLLPELRDSGSDHDEQKPATLLSLLRLRDASQNHVCPSFDVNRRFERKILKPLAKDMTSKFSSFESHLLLNLSK